LSAPRQPFVACFSCLRQQPLIISAFRFSVTPGRMRKETKASILIIVTALVLILIVYFVFEKRIEAIPDKIR
jgi:hypothetical protein